MQCEVSFHRCAPPSKNILRRKSSDFFLDYAVRASHSNQSSSFVSDKGLISSHNTYAPKGSITWLSLILHRCFDDNQQLHSVRTRRICQFGHLAKSLSSASSMSSAKCFVIAAFFICLMLRILICCARRSWKFCAHKFAAPENMCHLCSRLS